MFDMIEKFMKGEIYIVRRSPLLIGSEVGSYKKYIIDEIIGFGANCIVYDAHYEDGFGNKKSVKLKECYPAALNITRNDNVLIWENDSDKEFAFTHFTQSYQIASQMQNFNFTKSTVVYSLDIFEYNNTKYIAMIPENGISYDKDTSEDIEDIISTALALTNAIDRYHQNGYLHLDVKPSNFIVTKDHTGKGKNIALFDFDTLVPINNITNKMIKRVSYSKGWAAPEQVMQQISKLCPATDLFSVGAVLFERIMKRQVSNSDMSSLAKWEFDNRFDTKHVNPKAKRLLTEIFHKTLASNVKKRYQKASELSAALEELLYVITSGKPYIISSFPVSTCHFVGRNNELEELHNALKKNGKVFVFGPGGIGKSELAKRYIEIFADKYDAIVFLRYNGSILETLRSIKIKGIIDMNEKLNAIEELCDSRTLLVLDNFDVALDEDEYLERLLSLGGNTIIITRTDFSNVYPDIPCIKIEGMALNELRTIFEIESSRTLRDEEYIKYMPIIRMGKQCTYYLVLLAKLLKSGDYSLEELYDKVYAGLSEFDKTEDILNTKDGIRIKQTVAKAMTELFKLTKLTTQQSEMLLLLYHLSCLNLTKKQIREIVSIDKAVPVSERINALNALIERGFIDHNFWTITDTLTISDVIKDTIDYDVNPSIIDCNIVKMFIEQEFFKPKDFLSKINYDDVINQDRAEYSFCCIFKIIVNSNLSNHSTQEYFIDLLYRMLGGEESAAHYIWNEYTNHILHFLNIYSRDGMMDAVSKVKADIVLLTVFCYQTRVELFAPVEDIHIESMKRAEKFFYHALKEIEKHSIEDGRLIDDLCRPFVHCTHSSVRCQMMNPKLIDKILELQPACIKTNVTPSKSFEVNVFINSDYERHFLNQVKRQTKVMKDDERKEYIYRVLGKIMLNGLKVPFIIDDELYALRKELFSVCADRFENVEAIDPQDFAPDPIGISEHMFRIGWKYFMASIYIDAPERVNLRKEQDDWLLDVFGGEFATLDLPDFLEAIQNIDSAKRLCNAIDRYRSFVDAASDKELSEEDKKLLALTSERLNDKLNDSLILDDFPCDDGEILPINVEDAKAELYSINAVMHCILEDKAQIRTFLEKLIEHSKTYISYLSDDALIKFEHDIEADLYFWGAVNRLSNMSCADIVLPYLLDYTNMVKKRLKTYSDYDESWMYSYYKKIVDVASKAKEDLLPPSPKERLLWSIFKDEDSKESKALENYKHIINEYTSKIESITGFKYNP